MSGLANETYIVTGASRGIGRALALELARRGAGLVLNARDAEALAETAAACAEAGGKDVAEVAGSAGKDAVARALVDMALANAGENFAGVVHAAGVLRPGPHFWELPVAHCNEVFEAAVFAVHRLARHAFPALLKRGRGVFALFGSGAAEIAQPGIAAYCAAKAAEEHLVRQLALEAPAITTFAFRPGVVDTRMQEEARNAKGGGAKRLHAVFKPWHERGELLDPAVPARALTSILETDPRQFHGRVASLGFEQAGP
jgi:NAD(P)-dependent dehydrogenase (short-subunit alcohol dehydrogenase family)